VRIFRSARTAWVGSVRGMPHSEQNFAAGPFSWPQFGQTLTAEAYGPQGSGSTAVERRSGLR
jgi:hypothetical protein